MKPGQVSFHEKKPVIKLMVESKKGVGNPVRRLEKTKEERFPDLQAEQIARRVEIEQAEKEARKAAHKAEEALAKERAAERQAKSYDSLFDPENMETNKYGDDVDYREVEDDFM